MAIKESDLVTVTQSDFGSSDFVRVLDGSSSRKMTLSNFASSLSSPLQSLGFVTGDSTLFIRTVTSNHTALTTDRVILVDTSGGDKIVTLPNASDSSVYDSVTNKSLVYTIKKSTSDVNKVTIATSGSQTIDGFASYELLGPNLVGVTLISNGSNWFILNS